MESVQKQATNLLVTCFFAQTTWSDNLILVPLPDGTRDSIPRPDR